MRPEATARRTVWLVEDDPDHADIATYHLEAEDPSVRVERFVDGSEILDRIASFSDREADGWPWLVLLDLNLPKYGGHEVLSRIKSHASLRLVPVIIFSTSSAPDDVERALSLGANSYLTKPIELTGFETIMNTVWTYWRRNQHAVALGRGGRDT